MHECEKHHAPRNPSQSGGAALALCALGAVIAACAGPRTPEAAPASLRSLAPVPPRVAGPASDAAHDFVVPPPLESGLPDMRDAGEAGEEAVPPEPEPGLPLHGALISRYRLRATGDARDQDLYATLILDVGDPARQPWTAHVMGRIAGDLDGRDRDDQLVFPSLADTWDHSLTGLLYTAYADYERATHFDKVRLGRQIDFETPEFAYFDGAALETRAKGGRRARAGLYGGVPVHLYESSPSGDRLFGLFGEARPWKDARARLDWMHLEDERRLGSFDDDLFGLALWQKLRENIRVDGRFTRLEDENRDVRVRASWDDPRRDLALQLSWFRLLEPQRALALELDPFFESLQDHFPFQQFGLLASKGVGERVQVQAGADLRRVQDDGDVGQFNRDYERGFVSTTFREVLPSTALTLTGDAWDSDERDVRTWGIDLERRFGRGTRASIGSYYSLFKYDLLLGREKDDVRTYFVKLRKQRSKAVSFDVGYDFEDDDFERYHVLTLGATWRF